MLEKEEYSQQDVDYVFSLEKKERNTEGLNDKFLQTGVFSGVGHSASDIYKMLIMQKIFGGMKNRFEAENKGVRDKKQIVNWLSEDSIKCIDQNPNQMNIQSVYSEIDIDANGMETEFQASFDDLLWFVDKFLDNKGEGDYEDEPVEVIFNRDILINETEAIENCVNSRDILSEETITEQHPWTKNVQKEMNRKKAEREEHKAAADPYNNSFTQKNEGGALNE